MSLPSVTLAQRQVPSAFSEREIQLRLLRQEWRFCRSSVIPLAVTWFIGLWVLVLFFHPACLLAIGSWYVILVAPAQAGRDVIDGTEEFSFALPPGRSPLYLARLIPGLVFLTANGLLGGLAMAYNLPQHVWSLFFSGGLTEPFVPLAEGYWYAMAVLLPLAAHAVTFAVAANAGSRAAVNSSMLIGIAAAVGVMLAGFFLENLMWEETNGYLAGPALLVTAVLVMLGGHIAYLRKEATGSGGVAGGERGFGMAWIITIIVGLLFFMLITMFFRVSNVKSSAHEMERQRARIEQEARARAQAAESQAVSKPTPAATPEKDPP